MCRLDVSNKAFIMSKITATQKRQYAKVVLIEDDGDFIDVQFVRANGEIVTGMYKRWGWARPPADEAAEFQKIITGQPRLIRR